MKVVETRGELVARHVSDEQAHAATDVVADRLRHDEVARLGDRADGDPTSAMKVGREHHARELPGAVTPERSRELARALGAIDLIERLRDRHEGERLLDGLQLDGNVTVGEERDGNAGRV